MAVKRRSEMSTVVSYPFWFLLYLVIKILSFTSKFIAAAVPASEECRAHNCHFAHDMRCHIRFLVCLHIGHQNIHGFQWRDIGSHCGGFAAERVAFQADISHLRICFHGKKLEWPSQGAVTSCASHVNISFKDGFKHWSLIWTTVFGPGD